MKQITAEEEYQKNKSINKEDVTYMLEWVAKQPHLPKMSELEVILFLNCNSGSREATKNLIDIYYTCRTHCPEFFTNRDPKTLIDDLNVVFFGLLPGTETNPDIMRTFYGSFLITDPSKYNFLEQYKLGFMLLDIMLLKYGSCEGQQLILDMKGMQFAHMTKTNISLLKKALYYFQEAIPVKTKYIHIINVLPLIDKLLTIYKPFLSKEVQDKLILHTDGIESLYKYIPKNIVPQHLGGDGSDINKLHEEVKQNFLDAEDYFKEDEVTKRVDETKRQGKPKNAGIVFGIEGSFRKLDID